MNKYLKLNNSRLILLFSLVSLPYYAMAAIFSAGDILYDSNNPTPGQAAVVDYLGVGAAGAVSIPSSVSDGTNSYIVTMLDGTAFFSNGITSITIPNSVTSIGDRALQSNDLTTLTIPDSVIDIGSFAFSDNQLTSITIPDGVTAIGIFAFDNNLNLTEVWFDGDAPSIANTSFGGVNGKTLYYDCTKTGFTNPWQGYTTSAFCLARFDSQGGSPVPQQRVLVGGTVSEPTPPTRADFTFSGWFSDPAATVPYDFATTQSTPLTLYAGWASGNPSGDTKSIPSLSLWALALLGGLLVIARAIYRRQS